MLLLLVVPPTASFMHDDASCPRIIGRGIVPVGTAPPSFAQDRRLRILYNTGDDSDDENVRVGSKEYLEGFLSSPIQDSSVSERGSGLEQALKLGGSVAAGLVVLLLGFMASNGLL